MQNTLKIAKTDFEKKLTKRIEIRILYDHDLNFNQMKKLLRTDQISLTSCYFQNLKIYYINRLLWRILCFFQ